MIVYERPESTTFHMRYHQKWVQQFIQILSEQTEDGFVFRVDLDLRPEGRQGPLLISRDALQKYYKNRARFWERVAMLKYRFIVEEGPTEALAETIESFLQRDESETALGEALAHIRARIEAEEGAKGFNIKTGVGGIRDIEFIVHYFQLLSITRGLEMVRGSVLDLLEWMKRQSLLQDEDIEILRDAYHFFRRVEHILQYAGDQQKHELPKGVFRKPWLNRVWSFWALKQRGQQGSEAFEHCCQKVRNIFLRVMGVLETYEDNFVMLALDVDEPLHVREQALSRLGFVRCQDKLETIEILKKQDWDNWQCRELLMMCSADERPERIWRYCEAHIFLLPSQTIDRAHFRAMKSWFRWTGKSPWLLRIVTRDHDDCLAQDWIAREIAQDAISDIDSRTQQIDARFVELHRQYLQYDLSAREMLSALTHVGQSWLSNMWRAERAIDLTQDIPCLLYGSLAVEQLCVGSDLDLVIIVPDHIDRSTIEPHILRWLSRMRAALSAGKGFPVDLRLRPHGRQGQLLNSLSTWKDYQHHDAHFWEHLALVRSRFMSEDHQLKADCRQLLIEHKPDNLGWKTLDMRARILRERQSPNGFHIKISEGGLVDIDFMIAAVLWNALKDNDIPWHHNLYQMLDTLAEHRVIDTQDAAFLSHALDLYNHIRIWYWFLGEENEPVCQLHDALFEQCARQMNLGYSTAMQLQERLLDTAAQVREITGRYLNRLS